MKDEDKKNTEESESESDNEDDWEKYQFEIKKETALPAPKKKESLDVHCPYFPEVKNINRAKYALFNDVVFFVSDFDFY